MDDFNLFKVLVVHHFQIALPVLLANHLHCILLLLAILEPMKSIHKLNQCFRTNSYTGIVMLKTV